MLLLSPTLPHDWGREPRFIVAHQFDDDPPARRGAGKDANIKTSWLNETPSAPGPFQVLSVIRLQRLCVVVAQIVETILFNLERPLGILQQRTTDGHEIELAFV